jgi:Flp pilus assembly protein TadG
MKAAPAAARTHLTRRFGARRLVADRRGAAVVEFAIAILPVLITFFGMFQWGILAYVHLIVKHSAFVAARAEAVIHPQMPDSGPPTDVKKGVMELFKHVSLVKVSNVSVVSTGAGQYDQTMNNVTVTVDYECGVPLGNKIACTGKKYKFIETATFPNQGSSYQRVWGL